MELVYVMHSSFWWLCQSLFIRPVIPFPICAVICCLVDGHVLALDLNGSIVWKVWSMKLRIFAICSRKEVILTCLFCQKILSRKQLVVQYLLGRAYLLLILTRYIILYMDFTNICFLFYFFHLTLHINTCSASTKLSVFVAFWSLGIGVISYWVY